MEVFCAEAIDYHYQRIWWGFLWSMFPLCCGAQSISYGPKLQPIRSLIESLFVLMISGVASNYQSFKDFK